MASLGSVPCVQISSENLSIWWKHLIECADNCHFVALDLELSGLGTRSKLNAKQIDERYEAVLEAAKSRSILSIGLAFFSFADNKDNNCKNTNNESDVETNEQLDECCNDLISEETENRFEALNNELIDEIESDIDLSAETHSNGVENKWKFEAKVFNLLCLCDEEYVVEPETLKFLVGHGFDFNRQCLYGLPYHRGNDNDYEDYTKPSLRNLISHIISKKLPIVFHNGLIDLVFLYQNFYCDSPHDLQTFIADLVELFPSGIFDTKYIADFHERLSRSYLEYLFYERQRFNIERRFKGHVSVEFGFPAFPHDLLIDVEFKDLSTKLFANSNCVIDICRDYANHGWCKLNHLCSRSHNIDHILDKKKNQSKRIKKILQQFNKNNNQLNAQHVCSSDDASGSMRKKAKQGVHRAGYDAFMTGYCLAFFIAINSKNKADFKMPMNAKRLGIAHIVNNIYLTGKDQSLRVTASSFAKTSINHKNKILRLRTNK